MQKKFWFLVFCIALYLNNGKKLYPTLFYQFQRKRPFWAALIDNNTTKVIAIEGCTLLTQALKLVSNVAIQACGANLYEERRRKSLLSIGGSHLLSFFGSFTAKTYVRLKQISHQLLYSQCFDYKILKIS